MSFAVNMVSQFMKNPTEEHIKTVFRILKYLKMTFEQGLFFQEK